MGPSSHRRWISWPFIREKWIQFPKQWRISVQRFQLSSECSSLRTLVLADHSGLQESRFELNGYSELQRVRIGRYCYISETCSFAITNCPKLKSIQIGPESFSHCKSFELKGFPALQTIELGVENFWDTTSFALIGLLDWMIWTHRPSFTQVNQMW